VHNQEELLPLPLEIVLPEVRIQLTLHNSQVIVIQGTSHVGGVLTESGHQEADTPQTKATGVATSIFTIVGGLQEDLFTLRRPTNDIGPTAG